MTRDRNIGTAAPLKAAAVVESNTENNAPALRWDQCGSFARRTAFNNEGAGFAYLVVDPLPFTMYVKLSSRSGDWSQGQQFGIPNIAGIPGLADALADDDVQITALQQAIALLAPLKDAPLTGTPTLNNQPLASAGSIATALAAAQQAELSARSAAQQALAAASGMTAAPSAAALLDGNDGMAIVWGETSVGASQTTGGFATGQETSYTSFARSTQSGENGTNARINYIAANQREVSRNALTLATQGVGLFPASQNDATSQDFSNAAWTKSNVTVTPNADVAPDGTTTAALLQDTSTTAFGFLQHQISVVSDANARHEGVFVKPGTSNNVRISMSFVGGTVYTALAQFDLTGAGAVIGTPSGTGGVNPDVEIKQYPNGWYRIRMWCNNNNTGNNLCRFLIYPDYSSAAGNGNILAWYPAMNTGKRWPGVVSPRDGDKLTVPVSKGSWSNTAGTLAFDLNDIPVAANDVVLISADDGTANNYIRLSLTADNYLIGAFCTSSGGLFTFQSNDKVSRAAARWALTWNSGGADLIRAGVIVGTTTSATQRPVVTTIRFGHGLDGLGQPATAQSKFFQRPLRLGATIINNAGNKTIGGGSGSDTPSLSSANYLAAMDNAAMDKATALSRRVRNYLARPFSKFNFLCSVGQSFARGAYSNTGLLATEDFLAQYRAYWADAVQMGQAVRGPIAPGQTVFSTYYDEILHDLVATAESYNAYAAGQPAIATVAQLNAGVPTSYVGEPPIIALALEAKRRDLARKGLLRDTDHRYLAVNPGAVDNTAIAVIANINSDGYKRTVSAAQKAVSLAAAQGAACSDVARALNHGEADFRAGTPQSTYLVGDGNPVQTIPKSSDPSNPDYYVASDAEKAADAAKTQWGLYDLIEATHRDQTVRVFKQQERALWLAAVASSDWADDVGALPKAYLQAEEELNNFCIASTTYAGQFNAVNGAFHPTSAGSEFYGLKDAQAMDYIHSGRNFFIPRPDKIIWENNKIMLSAICLFYPVRIDPTWVDDYTRQMVQNNGFRVLIGGQESAITGVRKMPGYQSLIEITHSVSAPAQDPELCYALKTPARGRGNIYDSDPEIPLPWLYRITPGAFAGQDIVGITGKPIPFRNGMIPFRQTAVNIAA